MDLLEFGMEYEKSGSAVKRTLAKGALAAAKKQADLYEAYIMKQNVSIPEDSEDDAAMLEAIREEITQQP